MAPKLRRPAASPGRARGKAKAKAGPVRPRRPGPAAAKVIFSHAVTLEQCKGFTDLELMEATYWAEPVRATFKMESMQLDKGELYLKGRLLGTQSERLLKVATGLPDHRVDVHLCDYTCGGVPHRDDLIHVTKFKQLGDDREPWMSNLGPVEAPPDTGEDELQVLRADQRRRGGEAPGEGVAHGRDRRSRSRRRRSRSRKRRKTGLKVESQKEVVALFQNTGLDPDPKVRRRFRRRAGKIARKKRMGSSSSSGSSSDSSPAEETLPADDMHLFGGSGRVQLIGRRLPGSLAAAALDEASDALVTHEGGLWDLHSGALPPLFVRYFRQQLSSQMSPAMSREAQTISHLLDHLLRGKVADALDLGAQRLKALEAQASGVHFTVAQQQELIPKEAASMSTVVEMQDAARRAREEGKMRLESSRPYGARSSYPPRAEDHGKGNQRKGGKGKGGKTETKKGEGKKGDNKEAKGS